MTKYPKIKSIFKRDDKTHKFTSQFSCLEFEYLYGATWVFTEKVDGTNIRVIWKKDVENILEFRGRTDKANIPSTLLTKLEQLFTLEKMSKLGSSMCLYGEGYGAGIQKGGGKYSSEPNFVLFDIKIDGWWLRRETIEQIATVLGIDVVPIRGEGILGDAIDLVVKMKSKWGDFRAEGLVLKPKVQLFNRKGERIITKVKYSDF